MPYVPYPYEVNGKLVTGNGSLMPICSLSNSSLLPSLTVPLTRVYLETNQKPRYKRYQNCKSYAVHACGIKAVKMFTR